MEPVGFTYQAAIVCPECAAKLQFPYVDRDMGKAVYSTEDMGAVFAHDETDCPQCCFICFCFIPAALTTEGQEYVKEAVKEYKEFRSGNADVIAEWKEYYSYLFREEEEKGSD